MFWEIEMKLHRYRYKALTNPQFRLVNGWPAKVSSLQWLATRDFMYGRSTIMESTTPLEKSL